LHGGYSSGGLGDGRSPVGSKGEASVAGLGDEVSEKLKQFADIVDMF